MSAAKLDIHLRDLSVQLPNKKKLFAVQDWLIPYGKHLLVEGESGSGKTTLLHILAGLFVPEQGAIAVGENRLDKMNDDERCELRKASIGVIFQKLNLIEHLTVLENIQLVRSEKTSDSEIEKVLKKLSLTEKQNELCVGLSLGEQQRVAVARVLAQQPEIILADEPTSSLDEKNAQAVLDSLFDLAKNKTLIVVSHDHRLRSRFSDIKQFEELVR